MIKLSEKHGVNPSVDHCAMCGESYAAALFGRMDKDQEAPRYVCTGGLCGRCQEAKDKGAIFLIEVDESKSSPDEPWRTGRIVGVTENMIRRAFQPQELVDQILTRGLAWVPTEVFEMLGLVGEAVEKREIE